MNLINSVVLIGLITYVTATSIRSEGTLSIEDIMHSKSEANNFVVKIHRQNENSLVKRTAVRDPKLLWTDGRVPYILSEKYDSAAKSSIKKAMMEFHEKTCIRFEEQVNEEVPYISISPGDGCYSYIGKAIQYGENNVSVGEGCGVPQAIHELMHVLGFIHEHQRPDRDEFVKINFGNIMPDHEFDFSKYTWRQVQNLSVAYDYDSIMHYPRDAFAKDPQFKVITPLNGGIVIGEATTFSKGDLLKINRLYTCTDKL